MRTSKFIALAIIFGLSTGAFAATEGGRLRDGVQRLRGRLQPGGEPRPGGQPATGRAGHDPTRAPRRRAGGGGHATGRLGLAVQDHDVRAACVEQADERRLGGDRNDLRLGYVRGGAAPDGKLHAGAGVRIMAVDNDLHEVDGTDTGGRPTLAYGLS